MKDMIGAASAAAERLGVSNKYTRRVFEAQRKYEDGPDYLDQDDVERRTRQWIEAYPDYVRAAAAAEPRFELTDCGWMVTCHPTA